MRLTIKKINERIEKHGYVLYRGKDYFYFVPIDPEQRMLADTMVLTCQLGRLTLDQWEQELLDKIKEEEH